MANRANKKSKKDGKQSNNFKGKKGKYVHSALLWKVFLKFLTRSYADEKGGMLLLEGSTPQVHLTVATVRDKLDTENSELVRRPSMGANLAACTIAGGMEVLQHLPEAGALQGTASEAYEMTALAALKQMLEGAFGDHLKKINLAESKEVSQARPEVPVQGARRG